MKKFLLMSTLLIFSFNTTLIAEEKKCKKFSFGCKMGKYIEGTKNFQKEKWSESIKPSVKSKKK